MPHGGQINTTACEETELKVLELSAVPSTGTNSLHLQ